jgi:hypothetical protein
MAEGQLPVAMGQVEQAIRLLRGEKVILDADLAALYGVATRVLVQAVKRNLLACHENTTTFIDHFMHQQNWRCSPPFFKGGSGQACPVEITWDSK